MSFKHKFTYEEKEKILMEYVNGVRQYTSKVFKNKLDDAGMIQSMSRVSKCIDNGPMEAFWGMLKLEMNYLKTFNSYSELEKAVAEYIEYYNYNRYQKRLNCMTPIEYRNYLQSKVV